MGAKLPPPPLGHRFGEWEVIGDEYAVVRPTPRLPQGKTYYYVPCRCSCGNEVDVMGNHLRHGNSTKCKDCGVAANREWTKDGASLPIGTRFKTLETVALPRSIRGRYRVDLRCVVCGFEAVIGVVYLVGRDTGCQACAWAAVGTHRESRTRLYKIWSGMHTRCTNPNRNTWSRYGGRGIAVCPEWNTWEPFRDWAHANGYRDPEPGSSFVDRLTIDRVDVDGNYCPENCEWVTRRENTRRMHVAQGRTVA